LEWPIESDCSSIRIWSTLFDTEQTYDYVTIQGEKYSGTAAISVTVPAGNFIVYFHSDGSATKTGFALSWTCAGNL